MCGVFGFVSYNGHGPNLNRLKLIAEATESRGRHAFGFAWIDGRNRLRMYKQPGAISDHLDTLELLADARMLIGHCRYATHGLPSERINNHPHPADGGWVVHNGIMREYADIMHACGVPMVTHCDSEALSALIEIGAGSFWERCRDAASYADGAPLALLGLWARPHRLVAVSAGNPLHVGTVRGSRRYYLASLPIDLPGTVKPVPHGTVLEFTASRLVTHRDQPGLDPVPQASRFRWRG